MNPRSCRLRFALLAALFLSSAAPAWSQPHVQLNNFGAVGLFQTPTARSMGAGTMGIGYSRFDPIEGFLLHVQPLEWLQGNYRFVNITNPALSTDPSRNDFTDKGVDFQIRLLKESALLPQVALGMMDIGGNGLFAAEYLVMSRRWFNLDVHLGIGWGRLGTRADFGNPLGAIDDRFDDRQFDFTRPAGKFSPESYFTGDTALFGGLVWTPRGGPWSLILEVEGNDYQEELFAEDPDASEFAPPEQRFPATPDVDSRINFGLNYRYRDWADITASWQRNDTFGVQFTAFGDFDQVRGPEKSLRPRPAAIPAYSTQQRSARSRALSDARVERIRRELRGQWIYVHAIDVHEDTEVRAITIWINQVLGDSLPRAAGRVARTLIRHSGAHYDEFVIVTMTGGMESGRVVVPRDAFHRAAMGGGTADEFAQHVRVQGAQRSGYSGAAYRDLLRYPTFSHSIQPSVRSNIGGPENFAIAQLLARVAGTAQLSPRLGVTGSVGINIADNFGDRLDRDFPSGLPKVRSDIRRYLRTGKDVYLSQLEANYLFPVATDLHGRVSAGIFEEMFGGVGGELLYRRTNARWAVGLDLSHVWQRDFDQRFRFLDYNTTTGHLSYYHELPVQNLRLMVSVGRYLARDIGTTIDISRRFASGARFGVFASFTNVSSETFGEGAFDKGFYVSIPLSLFSPRDSGGQTLFSFRPLQRDGGQKVQSGRSLYSSFDRTHTRSLHRDHGDWVR